MTTFGAYIHWPFCAQKCPYCDFNSHVRFGGWDEPKFLAAYLREIEHTAAITGPRRVTSIFFGGGTPSLMQPQTVEAIIAALDRTWGVAGDAEITLEANPGSVEAARFRGYRAAGINRVSIGVQSLIDAELKKLGRIHTSEEAKAAVAIARSVFDRYSFDMIYARPKQTLDGWRAELDEALDLAGDHLSLYQLTIEPETPYATLHAAGKLVVPDGDAASDLYALTGEMTHARGYAAYEVSNYARPGAESRHNLLYWRYGEYAGIGPGAHGRVISDGQRLATLTERNPEAWCARVETLGTGLLESNVLTRADQADEMLLMGLRLIEGVDLARLAELGGVAADLRVVERLGALGLVEMLKSPEAQPEPARAAFSAQNELDPILQCAGPGLPPDRAPDPGPRGRIRATPEGRLVLNAVVAELSGSFRPLQPMDNTIAAL